MSLRDILTHYWRGFQPDLFGELEAEVGSLGERYEQLVQVFEFVRVEKLLYGGRVVGRPAKDRVALARAFLSKAVFDLPTTRDLIERLEADSKLRRLCGWRSVRAVPSEATFSRAFAEFAEGLAAGPVARSAGPPDHGRPLGRAHIAGCDGDRGAGEARAQAAGGGEAEAQAGAAAQGRGTAQATEPSGAPTVPAATRDAGRSAAGLQRRHQA